MIYTYKIIGGVPIWFDAADPETLFWVGDVEIDADGSPRAYAPLGKGLYPLDCLSDAGLPGSGYGVARDGYNIPYIQTAADPRPGYYISTTSLVNPLKKENDPARYVDAEAVPFFVLPSVPNIGARLGQVAMLFRPETGDSCAAIFADTGNRNEIGEVSIATAIRLGASENERSALHGGLSNIVTMLFKDSSHTWPRTNEEVANEAYGFFIKWGGMTHLKSKLQHLDWSKFEDNPPIPVAVPIILPVVVPVVIPPVAMTPGEQAYKSYIASLVAWEKLPKPMRDIWERSALIVSSR